MNLAVNAPRRMPKAACSRLATSAVEFDATIRPSAPTLKPGRYALVAVSDQEQA